MTPARAARPACLGPDGAGGTPAATDRDRGSDAAAGGTRAALRRVAQLEINVAPGLAKPWPTVLGSESLAGPPDGHGLQSVTVVCGLGGAGNSAVNNLIESGLD